MQTTQQTTQTGFTLIELMIAVAIVALLAAIAVPQYNGYVERARRTDATTALTRIAGQLERCYTQYGKYNDPDCAQYKTVNAADAKSEEEDYDLSIAAVAGSNAKQSYVLTAKARADGSQAQDEDCQTFTLNHLGVRDSTPGPEADTNCW
jgi:type IV pilus assembly protein PilE